MNKFKFPSPLGDYVFNLTDAAVILAMIQEFPSPLGDYVFNPLPFFVDYTIKKMVSVPSRGLCFQSLHK